MPHEIFFLYNASWQPAETGSITIARDDINRSRALWLSSQAEVERIRQRRRRKEMQLSIRSGADGGLDE